MPDGGSSADSSFILRDFEAVQIHHLAPGCYEVVDELLFRVRAAVNFGQGAKNRVGTENEIDSRRSPPNCARFTIKSFKEISFG